MGRHSEADALGLWKSCGLARVPALVDIIGRSCGERRKKRWPQKRKVGRVKQDPAMTTYTYRRGRNALPPQQARQRPIEKQQPPQPPQPPQARQAHPAQPPHRPQPPQRHQANCWPAGFAVFSLSKT
jgi:hypothetical protein